jgi:hypothetical protein
MKSVFTVLGLLLSLQAFASDPNSCEVAQPKPSCSCKLPRKHRKHKVIVKHACTKQVVVVEKSVIVEKTVEVEVIRKNRLRLLGGVGPTGSTIIAAPGIVTLSRDYGLVFGLGYSRLLSQRVSLEINVLSNATGLAGVGYDF